MSLTFPSAEFDDAVAAVCHGLVSDDQAQALNGLLRENPVARDEYILRIELHARLAWQRDHFITGTSGADGISPVIQPIPDPAIARPGNPWRRFRGWAAVAAAACLAVTGAGWWAWNGGRNEERRGATSQAVAMLNRVVNAHWTAGSRAPEPGSPLEPGWLRLDSGLAQVVFYSGVRLVIEGPAEFQLLSPGEALCRSGRFMAEVPTQAIGFRLRTPQMNITDLGTQFGVDVTALRTEAHVFKGSVEIQTSLASEKRKLDEGSGAGAEHSHPLRLITANPAAFASLFELQAKSVDSDFSRYARWREASQGLNGDPSLLVHFDFEEAGPPDWLLRNASRAGAAEPSGTIVGCQPTEGRWPQKPALEFRGVSDRVRLRVPGEFDSMTLAAWVRIQGLDREFNSLFMCDGFGPGTVHWLIRKDGVLGLTVIGSPADNYQIVASPSVLPLDQFGMWIHLAVVLDGNAKRVTHYLNGRAVAGKALRIRPPFRVGIAELGNWNASGFTENDPALIRNFSGAMDEFCLFSRALSADEISALRDSGRQQPETGAGPR
ncbi:MAG: LamG-like jellyroll fold domain-containing protein [Verrucomicrobiota bacterium]